MAISAENFPKMKEGAEVLAGKNILLYINYGVSASVESPKWVLVGGQRNSPLDMTANEIDASDKTSDGWGSTIAGTKTWKIEQECIYKLGDQGFEAMRDAFLNDRPVYILRRASNGDAMEGWASVTSFSDDNSYEDVVTATISLTGVGAPVFKNMPEAPSQA